jgi:hypothetical protein
MPIVVRLLWCCATAVVVAVTAYLCAWLNYGHHSTLRPQQWDTRRLLNALQDELEHHKQANGTYPATLTELEKVKKQEVGFVSESKLNHKRMQVDGIGRPLDGWGNPFHYRTEAGGYILYSLGRDAQPGGVGLDADLYAGQEDYWNEYPTLWQFTTQLNTGGIRFTCILAGVLAFPLCLLAKAKWRPEDDPSWARILLVNALTVVFAILTALVMAVHYLPAEYPVSGH